MMLEKIVQWVTNQRYFVVFLVLLFSILGAISLKYLPNDAVPDITNNQVQINASVSGFSPVEMEKQVTFPIETALSGIPGLQYTRSLSRNGFSQVTAVFNDDVNIYFARQQVSEKLTEAKENLPANVDPKMGAISTGLGEIYMWTLQYSEPKKTKIEEGKPGFQPDGSYLTPEGMILKKDFEKIGYLRTLQDWVIKPQLRTITVVAGIDSIGGYVKQYHVQPDPYKMIALGLSFSDIQEIVEKNNQSLGAGYIEKNGESLTVRADGYGAVIDKQWLVQNSGTCDWDSTYRFIHIGGADLGAQTEASLLPAHAGMNATIQIIFTAPFTDGEYESAWQAFDPGGLAFGDPIYIRVNVVAPRESDAPAVELPTHDQ